MGEPPAGELCAAAATASRGGWPAGAGTDHAGGRGAPPGQAPPTPVPLAEAWIGRRRGSPRRLVARTTPRCRPDAMSDLLANFGLVGIVGRVAAGPRGRRPPDGAGRLSPGPGRVQAPRALVRGAQARCAAGCPRSRNRSLRRFLEVAPVAEVEQAHVVHEQHRPWACPTRPGVAYLRTQPPALCSWAAGPLLETPPAAIRFSSLVGMAACAAGPPTSSAVSGGTAFPTPLPAQRPRRSPPARGGRSGTRPRSRFSPVRQPAAPTPRRGRSLLTTITSPLARLQRVAGDVLVLRPAPRSRASRTRQQPRPPALQSP